MLFRQITRLSVLSNAVANPHSLLDRRRLLDDMRIDIHQMRSDNKRKEKKRGGEKRKADVGKKGRKAYKGQ